MSATGTTVARDARPAKAPAHAAGARQGISSGLRSGNASSVLVATINRPAGETGIHTHTRLLDEGFRAAGIGCAVVTPFSGSRTWLPIFAVRPLALRHVNKTWATRWHRHWHLAALRRNLRQRLKARPFSHVIAQCPVSAAAAMLARGDVGREDDLPITLVCHFNHSEATEYRDKGELADPISYEAVLDFEADVLQSVDRVAYVSQWARETVEVTRGIRTRASVVIPNGVDDARAVTPLARASIHLAANDLVFINVGTLEPRKNQAALLELFALVAADEPAAKLVLVGDGPDRPTIERRVRELGLASAVRLLGHRTDVAALLPLADVYVHYAVAENCPMVLLEAARAGLPGAAPSSGGVAELQDRLGGHVPLDPADLTSSAATLVALLRDGARRAAMGRACRDNFRHRYTRDAMVRAYVHALELAPPAGTTTSGGAAS